MFNIYVQGILEGIGYLVGVYSVDFGLQYSFRFDFFFDGQVVDSYGFRFYRLQGDE